MPKRSKREPTGDPIPDDVLDRLYGAPPSEFVAKRDAAARDLKKEGDDEAAKAVKALRRPTAAAAGINRAVRAEPDQVRALLDAADDLRRAHEAVMQGKAERDALKAATSAERQAITALARTAATEAAGDRVASADLERRIRDTLEAVALDPGLRERFAAGRLERDARASTLAMDVPVTARPAPQRKRRPDDRAKRKADERELRKVRDALRRAEASVERRRRNVEKAETARERADAALRDAREELRAAEADLRAARKAADGLVSRGEL
jgi:hypothetical protein